jgi:spore maturation protein CgeB
VPDAEILIARSPEEVLRPLREMGPDAARKIGARARARVLREHTSEHRAHQLENYVHACRPTVRAADRPTLVKRASGSTLH